VRTLKRLNSQKYLWGSRGLLYDTSARNTKLTTAITVPSSVCCINAELHWVGKQNLWCRPVLRHSPRRASSMVAHRHSSRRASSMAAHRQLRNEGHLKKSGYYLWTSKTQRDVLRACPIAVRLTVWSTRYSVDRSHISDFHHTVSVIAYRYSYYRHFHTYLF
jgi:hypothetical protein